MKLFDFINDISSSSKEIIYFGGSFNPWHEGHSECLRKAPKNPLKIVIPDHNPHKEFSVRSLDLDEELIKSLNSNIHIYTGFFEQQINNPTIDWIADISLKLKSHKHSLLIGHDSYINLSKWKNYQELLKCLDKIYVLDRENESNERLYDINTVFLGSHKFEKLSSTKLRKKPLQK